MSGSARRRILLTGASGYVGGRLLGAREKAGEKVRCLARNPHYVEGRLLRIGGSSVSSQNQ